jgi:F-type H+-transporting ATPase subunit epsilon
VSPTLIDLKILLPSKVFSQVGDVSRVVAETPRGSFGILPHRCDCVAALAPGILIYETNANGVVYVAVNDGVLVKTGASVVVTVRNAVGGTNLGQLRAVVEREFLKLSEEERGVRSMIAKLESDFIRRTLELHHA